jgi:hypothetical protein
MWFMVNCCVNPDCIAEHKLLRIGDVYAVERVGAKPKFVWLCSTCAAGFAVSLGPNGSAAVKRRNGAKETTKPPSGVSLRLVERGVRGIPLQRPETAGVHPVNQHSGDRVGEEHGAHV